MTIDLTVQPHEVLSRKTNLHFFFSLLFSFQFLVGRLRSDDLLFGFYQSRKRGLKSEKQKPITGLDPVFFFRPGAVGSAKLGAPAGGTPWRPSGPERFIPIVAAAHAGERALPGHLDSAPFYAKSKPIDQHPGNLAPGALEYSSESLARNIHLLRRLLMISAVQVGEPDGFEFIDCQRDRLQRGSRNSRGFENSATRFAVNSAAAFRPWHNRILHEVL
jgi:hypothetical protein